jgi:hypothetical protein
MIPTAMMNKFKYSFLFAFVSLLLTNCNDDGLNFSMTPSIGFAKSSAVVQEDDISPLEVALYSNAGVDETVTVEVALTEIGVDYGVDYITSPAAVDGIITLTIEPEDTNPAFTVTALGLTSETVRKINFELVSVTGGNLSLAQSATLSFLYTIAEKGVDPNLLTIAAVKAQYSGSPITLSETKYIEGVVTSSNDNVTSKNVFIQDNTGGVVLRFNVSNVTHASKLVPGDFVRVPLNGVTLTAFNGLIQLGDGTATLPHENIIKLGTQELPTPMVVTVEQLNSNAYQSMLVKVEGITFPDANGTKTVVGSVSFTNGTTTSTMRVETYAPFASKILPSGSVSITGVASYFNAAQLVPMKESDIQ